MVRSAPGALTSITSGLRNSSALLGAADRAAAAVSALTRKQLQRILTPRTYWTMARLSRTELIPELCSKYKGILRTTKGNGGTPSPLTFLAPVALLLLTEARRYAARPFGLRATKNWAIRSETFGSRRIRMCPNWLVS